MKHDISYGDAWHVFLVLMSDSSSPTYTKWIASGAEGLAAGADGLDVGADGLAARAKDREEGLETLECLDLVEEIEVPSDGLTIGLEEPNMLCNPDICWLGLNIIW